MTDTTKLEAAFNSWLRELPHNLKLRQQFWLAWKAGADWALDEVRERAGFPSREQDCASEQLQETK